MRSGDETVERRREQSEEAPDDAEETAAAGKLTWRLSSCRCQRKKKRLQLVASQSLQQIQQQHWSCCSRRLAWLYTQKTERRTQDAVRNPHEIVPTVCPVLLTVCVRF